MYVKVFAQILRSTIAKDHITRWVFEDLLKLADSDGVVDVDRESVARLTNVPLDIVNRGISELEKPDPNSRSQEHDGRRIVRLDDSRDWGWLIVNYQYYRNLTTENQRREKTRERVRRFREKQKSNGLHPGNDADKVDPRAESAPKPSNAVAEAIYELYPRRVGRPAAVKAITRALAKIQPDDLTAKTRAFARVWTGSDLQFCPNPSTWFNQERFNDDPATWMKSETPPPKKQFTPNI